MKAKRALAALFALLILVVIIAATAGGGKSSGAMSAAEQIAAHPHGAVARAYWQRSCTQNPHRDICVGVVNPDGSHGPNWNRP